MCVSIIFNYQHIQYTQNVNNKILKRRDINEIKIIEFTEDKKQSVQHLLKGIFNNIGFDFDIKNKDKDLTHISEVYQKENGNFWLLYYENILIGTIAIKKENDYYELKRFFIQKDYRGNGYGNILLTMVINHAKKSNIAIIRLDVSRKLSQAIHLYKKYGFKEITCYNNTSFPDTLWMELKIQ